MPLDPEKLRDAMVAKKIGPAELARRTGILPAGVSRILAGGQPNPKLATLETLAAALGCKLDKLVTVGERSL